jgi:hypothetical protein
VWAAILALTPHQATAAGVRTLIFLLVIHWAILSVVLSGNRSCDYRRRAAAVKMILALPKTSQWVGNEQDQQNGPEPNASTTSITPAAVPVISPAATQHQNQDNDQDQHAVLLFLFTVSGK